MDRVLSVSRLRQMSRMATWGIEYVVEEWLEEVLEFVIVVDLKATSLPNAQRNADVHHASMDSRSASSSKRRLSIKVVYFFDAVPIVVFGDELSKKSQAINPLAARMPQLMMQQMKE
ncbi:Hypothetical predicted protein [Olea europaea subsp. europaea]|uniref:Uncharacterized protein n=1 Tax=Olea europaea subsp. europaea TaxID=158383 RepID=A0A8S0TS86_OLEEU|nr:Hypothetical predicted protein [Olea europaea subsp. europaea]